MGPASTSSDVIAVFSGEFSPEPKAVGMRISR